MKICMIAKHDWEDWKMIFAGLTTVLIGKKRTCKECGKIEEISI